MKLSVVIPVYNVEQYLDQCVQSVLAVPGEIEVLLVDDGSKDSSGRLCDRWAEKDSRVVVIHQENGGLSAARNTGIRNAAGEYVMFLDSDDFLDQRETERLYHLLDGTADVVVGRYNNYFEAEDRSVPEGEAPFSGRTGLMDRDAFFQCVPKSGTDSYLVAVRCVVRREFLLEHDLFFFPGIYHEDEEWSPRVFCRAEGIYLSDCWFYQYRQARAGSITANIRPKHIWDTFTIMEHLQELLREYQAEPVAAEFLSRRIASRYFSNLLAFRVLSKEEKNRAFARLNPYTKLCLPYLSGAKGALARTLIGLLGLRGAESVLSAIQTLRGK